jgi:hypothetical protein
MAAKTCPTASAAQRSFLASFIAQNPALPTGPFLASPNPRFFTARGEPVYAFRSRAMSMVYRDRTTLPATRVPFVSSSCCLAALRRACTHARREARSGRHKYQPGISQMNGHRAKERGRIDFRRRSFWRRLCLFVAISTARGMAAKKTQKTQNEEQGARNDR